jgi:hypothetical protein
MCRSLSARGQQERQNLLFERNRLLEGARRLCYIENQTVLKNDLHKKLRVSRRKIVSHTQH